MMRRRLALLGSCLCLIGAGGDAASSRKQCISQSYTQRLIHIGRHATGTAQGIAAARLDTGTGKLTTLGLAASIEHPTWLQPDPKRPVLYLVSELGPVLLRTLQFDGQLQGPGYKLRVA